MIAGAGVAVGLLAALGLFFFQRRKASSGRDGSPVPFEEQSKDDLEEQLLPSSVRPKQGAGAGAGAGPEPFSPRFVPRGSSLVQRTNGSDASPVPQLSSERILAEQEQAQLDARAGERTHPSGRPVSELQVVSTAVALLSA